jgi:hypothetical protein
MRRAVGGDVPEAPRPQNGGGDPEEKRRRFPTGPRAGQGPIQQGQNPRVPRGVLGQHRQPDRDARARQPPHRPPGQSLRPGPEAREEKEQHRGIDEKPIGRKPKRRRQSGQHRGGNRRDDEPTGQEKNHQGRASGKEEGQQTNGPQTAVCDFPKKSQGVMVEGRIDHAGRLAPFPPAVGRPRVIGHKIVRAGGVVQEAPGHQDVVMVIDEIGPAHERRPEGQGKEEHPNGGGDFFHRGHYRKSGAVGRLAADGPLAFERPVHRVLSPRRARGRTISLGGALPRRSSGPPETGPSEDGAASGRRLLANRSLLALLRAGFAAPRLSTRSRELLPPVFTLAGPPRGGRGRFVFCGTFRRGKRRPPPFR